MDHPVSEASGKDTMARRQFLARLGLAAGGALAGMAVLLGASGCARVRAEPTTNTVTVDASACIGCRRCVAVAPGAFRMNPQTKKAETIPGAPAAALRRGAAACPVHAIH